MSHGIKVHINYNKQRSFCYYNKDTECEIECSLELDYEFQQQSE